MSNEPSSLIEGHIEKMGIAFPIAKLKGETTDRIYGVKSFPSAVLVDAAGRVIWKDHPARLTSTTIEEALEQASFVAPTGNEDYEALDELLAAREFGKARAAIAKGLAKAGDDEVLKGASAAIDGLLERMRARAQAALDAGDYGTALATHLEIETLFQGDATAKEAKAAAKAIEKDPAAKEELKAWEKLVKADEKQIEGDFEKAGKLYASLAKKYPDTKAAVRAQAFLSRHPL